MNFRECARITRENAKSFYFASFPLPPAKRNATYATYAFCRTADDIVDEAKPGMEAESRRQLDEFREMLRGIERGNVPDHELWGPFASTIHTYSIPTTPFFTLLDGIESDLTPRRFESFPQLRHYCYQVGSTVGLALSHIFGFAEGRALDYAANMGIAMQLTNIIRDVAADYRIGRVYLPLDELESFGCSEKTIADGIVTDPFREFLKFQIARSREFYRRAFQGIRFLTRDGSHWTALLMGDVYRSILDDVERNDYNVFGRRASVNLRVKLARTIVAPLTYRRDVLADSKPIIALSEFES